MEFRNNSNRISERRAAQLRPTSHESAIPHPQKQPSPADGKLLQVFQRIRRIVSKQGTRERKYSTQYRETLARCGQKNDV